MLPKGIIAEPFKEFILNLNKVEQKDRDSVIEAFCDKLEEVVLKAIKSSTIIIPTGAIQVQGSPGAQTNVVPLTLNNVIR